MRPHNRQSVFSRSSSSQAESGCTSRSPSLLESQASSEDREGLRRAVGNRWSARGAGRLCWCSEQGGATYQLTASSASSTTPFASTLLPCSASASSAACTCSSHPSSCRRRSRHVPGVRGLRVRVHQGKRWVQADWRCCVRLATQDQVNVSRTTANQAAASLSSSRSLSPFLSNERRREGRTPGMHQQPNREDRLR